MKELDMLIIEGELNNLEAVFIRTLENYHSMIAEGVTDLSAAPDDLMGMFDEASKRFEAARRGIGLTNKLPPGPERAQHRSRIMGNLNRLRALVDRIVRTADSENFSQGQENRFTQQRNQVA